MGTVDEEPRFLLRIYPDYGHDWPLWAEGPTVGIREGAMTPTDLGLSDTLTADLREWHNIWVGHFDYLAGWDNLRHADAYARRGHEIRLGLVREIGAIADIRLEI